MTTEALKSTSITNSDASPRVPNQAGKGSADRWKVHDDYVTTTTGKTSGSTYRFVRVSSNAIVKKVVLETEAQGSSTAMDIGVYYADTPDASNANNGAVIDADFFASAVDVSSAVKSDVTNESGTYTVNKRAQPLWQAVGLSSDPGGKFDIVATNTATINTGARMALEVHTAESNG